MENDNQITDSVTENVPQPNESAAPIENTLRANKKNKVFKIIILVVLFIAAVSSAAFYLLGGTPSKKLTAAFAATGIEFGKSNSLLKHIDDNEDLTSIFETDKTEQKFKLTLKDIGGDISTELDSAKVLFVNSGIEIDIKSDNEAGQYNLNWNNIVMGNPFVSFDFYRDDEKTVLSVPELYNKSVYFNNENAYENFLASDLSKSENGFTDFIGSLAQNPEAKSGMDYKGIIERYCTQNADDLNNFRKSIKVSKADKKSFNFFDTDVLCKGYKMTIPSKAVSELALSIKEFANNDEQCRAFLSAMSGSKGSSSYINEFNENIDDIINTNQDLYIYYYVNNGKIRAIECSDSSSTKINILLKGKNNIFDSSEFLMTGLGSSENDEIRITRETFEDGSAFNDKVVLTGKVNGAESSITLEGAYDKALRSCNALLESKTEGTGEIVRIELNGNIADNENGKAFNIDNLTLSSEVMKLIFTANYSINSITESVVQPHSDIDLFAAKQSEINSIMSELQSNLQKKVYSLILSAAFY